MTNQAILTKAIEKAIAGGWRFELPNLDVRETYTGSGELVIGKLIKYEDSEWFSEDEDTYSVSDIIFNHDFAKALWGEEPTTYQIYYKVSASKGKSKSTVASKPGLLEWQKHLQQMVIADDPIAYLGENL